MAAFLLEVLPEGRIGVRGLERVPFPHTCLSRSLFGVGCPGCGLTRSFIHLADADWRSSVEVHRVGWILALAVLVQIPYRLGALLGPNAAPLGRVIPMTFAWLLIALLIGNWLFEIAERLISDPN